MNATETTASTFDQLKRRQQQMWASGDFHAVATLIQPVADALCDAAALQAGWQVRDVATGSGNAALAAAPTATPSKRSPTIVELSSEC